MGDFDLVHDNQSLGYGLLATEKLIPTLGTIHHPITRRPPARDRARAERRKRLTLGRWYTFMKMQGRVARHMPRIVMVSENSIKDIHGDMGGAAPPHAARARRRRP